MTGRGRACAVAAGPGPRPVAAGSIGARGGTGIDDGSGPPDGAAPAAGPARISHAELRRVFGAFPTGVTALAALVDGVPVGMAASSFTSVSLDPPLVSVCVATTSRTWPPLRRAARIGVSVLSHEQEEASRRLAARGTDRFAGLAWYPTEDGAVLLAGASAWLDCSVQREIRAGDHEIVLLAVHGLDTDPAAPPLVFHASRYRRLAACGRDESEY